MTSAIRASLAELANGDIDIRGARSAVRAAIRAGSVLIDTAYAAIRDATFRIVSSRDQDVDLGLWFDLSTHAASLARQAERSDLAERFTGFAELIAQTGRFAERQPVDELLGRKHVAEILAVLGQHSGAAPRALLAEKTSLANANLSRVLGILSAHGLVRRSRAGKEARIGLTDAGKVAAARLGYVSASAPKALQWWRALSVPVAVWTSDGEPLGVNEAFRDLASAIGSPAPSMLSYEAWEDLVAATAQEIHATGKRGVRDLKLVNGQWVRVVEERLGDGQRLVFLVDFSDRMIIQEQTNRALAKRNEQVAALKAELADVRAKLEDTERRLLSFTNWLEQAKKAFAGETASLASKLHRWRRRVTSHKLREEADDADRQIAALKNAMQTLLYTSHWTKGALEPLQIVDLQSMVADPVEIVQNLGKHRIDFDASGISLMPAIKGHLPEIQAAIGQGLYHFVHAKPAHRYLVTTDVLERSLQVLCLSAPGNGTRRPGHSMDWYLQHADDPLVFHAGLGHARDVAEIIGGTIQLGKDNSYVIMSLPIELAGKRGKARGTKSAKAIP